MKFSKKISFIILLTQMSVAGDINKFIGLNLGYTFMQNNNKSTAILLQDIETKGINYGGEVGIKIKSHYTLSLNYDKIDLSDVEMDNYFIDIGYQMTSKFKPYYGVSLGKSSLNWQKTPFVTTQNTDLTSLSFMWGAYVGMEEIIMSDYSIFMEGRYMNFSHGTDIVDNGNNFTAGHKNSIKLDIGIRYTF